MSEMIVLTSGKVIHSLLHLYLSSTFSIYEFRRVTGVEFSEEVGGDWERSAMSFHHAQPGKTHS